MNFAGNLIEPCTRAIVTSPDSIGCRSISSTYRENSGNSSRNRIPWCASETSPGRGIDPPPINACAVVEWCGVRTGRESISATESGSSPSAE